MLFDLHSTRLHRRLILTATVFLGMGLAACEPQPESTFPMRLSQTGMVMNASIDEISGMQSSRRHEGVIWVHNDDGKPRLWAIDETGFVLGHVDIRGGKNKDWEDITLIPGEDHDYLVAGDHGDNSAKRDEVVLYIVPEPSPDADGRFSGEVEASNRIRLTYPGGARDTESMAWDPIGERLLLLSKRDRPPRLYALDRETLMNQTSATLLDLGEIDIFRPPSLKDRNAFGKRAKWVAQPTGMDISADGQRAAVISYRSLYLFELGAHDDWADALRAPLGEIYGPALMTEESVGFSTDGESVYVSAEGIPAPIFRFYYPDQEHEMNSGSDAVPVE